MKKLVLCFLVISILCLNNVLALGIIPGLVKANFYPDFQTSLEYKVSDSASDDLEILVEGDLKDYITVDKSILKKGENSFNVNIHLPKTKEAIDPPGPQYTYIRVREKVDEELLNGAIGTAISIRGLILIQVPYPGKYIESTLYAKNANIGEPIQFELTVNSRGEEDLVMKPRIEIYSENDELIEVLNFSERPLKSQEKVELKKVLDTSNYLSGDYYAVSKIDYDTGISESRADFKVGDLVVNIGNYSDRIPIGGVQKFNLSISSGWNDKIDGAFAEVLFYDDSGEIIGDLRTAPTDISPWEERVIEGYFDTSNFKEGFYDANATILYYGRDRGESTSEILKVEFYKKSFNYLVWIVAPSGVLLVLGLIIYYLLRRNGGRNGRKSKK